MTDIHCSRCMVSKGCLAEQCARWSGIHKSSYGKIALGYETADDVLIWVDQDMVPEEANGFLSVLC
jgi:hypothetical protein